MALDVEAVKNVLSEFPDPETGRDVMHMDQIADLDVSAGKITCTLQLATHSAPLWETARQDLIQRLQATFPDAEVEVALATLDRPPTPLGEIGLTAKSVIAVASGKGGVGKSTIAVALAYGLHRTGSLVGLMDADVYGPSVPHLLGLGAAGRPEIMATAATGADGKPTTINRIRPIEKDGMAVMSMGFLVPPDEAIVWRGPMLHGAITQFLRDTNWGPLDYLIIDMPPGTGDIALTLSQLLPLTGSVVVCTPQDVALLDVVKAIAMFRKVNIPVLGMVENMSGFDCPDCGNHHDIFGKGGARRRAEELDVPFLGEVPLHIGLRELGDAGRMQQAFDQPQTAAVFEKLAFQLVEHLASSAAARPPLPPLPVL